MLDGKYEDVLNRYSKELADMRELFLKEKDNPPIARNMPENAGKIAWARSITGRIKAPIDKFKTKVKKLQAPHFMEVAKKYVDLAKMLDKEYEATIYENWVKNNREMVIKKLENNILTASPGHDGKKTYQVNFDPELKVTIREAKFLSQIGKDIPATITNIALQEKDYMRHQDKLQQLLRAYDGALDGLKPVECRLLKNEILKLNRFMDKGAENHNWFSLSIDQYI
jgi:dynein heavy chain